MNRIKILLIIFVSINAENYNAENNKYTPIELSEFLDGIFVPKSWNGSWIAENKFVYKNKSNDVLVSDLATKLHKVILTANEYKQFADASFSFSKDMQYILLKHNVSSTFRHSSTALYSVYDLKNRKYYTLANYQKIQFATWFPNGHELVYVLENNIYYTKDITTNEYPIMLTKNGVPGIIYNGVPDWVYEEEVLSSSSALWISPDGAHVAFASFNDSNVRKFDYIVYGKPGSIDDQYPKVREIRYPKVGTPNPVVDVYVANLNSTIKITNLNPIKNAKIALKEHILYGLRWITEQDIALIYTNRVQNESFLIHCNLKQNCKLIEHFKQPKGWVDAMLPYYNKNGTRFIKIAPRAEGNDFYNHLVNEKGEYLTTGLYEVTTIFGWDEVNNIFYFGGSREKHHSEQHVYSLNLKNKTRRCLSCDLETNFGLCKYASASFSHNFNFYALICKGPGPVYVELRNAQKENVVYMWEDNRNIVKHLSLKLKPIVRDLEILLPSHESSTKVRMFLPPYLNKTEKYPVLVNVYAGPNSNIISDAFSTEFKDYMVTNQRCIYVQIDGTGSGRQGQKKRFGVYRKLAGPEVEDQITAMAYLQKMYPFIDKNRTAVWGWSYGGFSTAWILAKSGDIFKCGASVAPVTNYIYYDSIYTERYMGLFADNENGYNQTDISRNIEAFKNKQYLLIHGNGDDNVHYQQSMIFAKSLETADILFQQQSYPDETHSLIHVRHHLYHTLDKFFKRCFGNF